MVNKRGIYEFMYAELYVHEFRCMLEFNIIELKIFSFEMRNSQEKQKNNFKK